MKTNIHIGIVANSKTRVRCIYCGVFIPKAEKCIDQHENGSKHKENVQLMSENGLQCKEVEVYCKPCKRSLAEEESVLKHITEDDDHVNWWAAVEDLIEGELINIYKYFISDNQHAFCEACHCNVSGELHAIESHVNSFDHRAKVVDHLKPRNGIFDCEDDSEVWCKICEVYFDNTVSNILDHIDDDEEHVNWMQLMKSTIAGHDITIDYYLSKEDELSAYCYKCPAHIICNLESMEEHVNSEAHRIHIHVLF